MLPFYKNQSILFKQSTISHKYETIMEQRKYSIRLSTHLKGLSADVKNDTNDEANVSLYSLYLTL